MLITNMLYLKIALLKQNPQYISFIIKNSILGFALKVSKYLIFN